MPRSRKPKPKKHFLGRGTLISGILLLSTFPVAIYLIDHASLDVASTFLYFVAIPSTLIGTVLLILYFVERSPDSPTVYGNTASTNGIQCPYCHNSIVPTLRHQGGVAKSTMKGAIFLPWGIKEILKKDAYYCPKCSMKISEA